MFRRFVLKPVTLCKHEPRASTSTHATDDPTDRAPPCCVNRASVSRPKAGILSVAHLCNNAHDVVMGRILDWSKVPRGAVVALSLPLNMFINRAHEIGIE